MADPKELADQPAGFAHLSQQMYEYACSITREMIKGNLGPTPGFSKETAVPLTAVILCHTSLEAYVNEFLAIRKSAGGGKWEAAISELQRANFHEKWALAAIILGEKSFEKSAEPYQSFSLLCTLRNALIHYDPQFLPITEFPTKRLGSLETKFPFSYPGRTLWTNQVLNLECARWACRTVREMIGKFHNLVGGPDLVSLQPGGWSDPP
jgi:hypothetical protein